MLVLSRKMRESIVVGGAGAHAQFLKGTVLQIKRDRVGLGFEADAAIAVHRWEGWERIRAGDGPGPLEGDPSEEVVG